MRRGWADGRRLPGVEGAGGRRDAAWVRGEEGEGQGGEGVV